MGPLAGSIPSKQEPKGVDKSKTCKMVHKVSKELAVVVCLDDPMDGSHPAFQNDLISILKIRHIQSRFLNTSMNFQVL